MKNRYEDKTVFPKIGLNEKSKYHKDYYSNKIIAKKKKKP